MFYNLKIDLSDENVKPATTGRVRKMLKYFKGKHVNILYEYRDSMGHSSNYSYVGVYDSFVIRNPYCDICYFELYENGKKVFEHDVDCSYYEFYGLGKLRYNISGPECRLTFSRANIWLQLKACVQNNNIHF